MMTEHLAKEVKLFCRFMWSWDSIVSIVTGLCGLDGAGFECWHEQEIFLFATSRPAQGPTQPPIQWVPLFFSGGKGVTV
jgi:hypothetical protein